MAKTGNWAHTLSTLSSFKKSKKKNTLQVYADVSILNKNNVFLVFYG